MQQKILCGHHLNREAVQKQERMYAKILEGHRVVIFLFDEKCKHVPVA